MTRPCSLSFRLPSLSRSVSSRRAFAFLSFAASWRALHIRENPGEVVPIRYRLNHEIVRVYGRPRKLEAPPNNMILSGLVPIQVDFKAVDGFVYDDVESSLTLGLASTSEGGFIFPVVFPVTTLPVGLSQSQAVVGGDAPTYPIVRFNGPVTNPELACDDWTLRIDDTIEWMDDRVAIEGTPHP